MNNERNLLLARARNDYDPALVIIDETILGSIAWPSSASSPMKLNIHGEKGVDAPSALAFLVAMSSINYRFWKLSPEGHLTRYHYADKTGARALWMAFESAWGHEEASPSRFIRRFQDEGFHALFGDMPGEKERIAILSEVLAGDSLQSLCVSMSESVLYSSEVCVEHARQLASAFPMAFGDPYLKKAQLALSLFAAYLRVLSGNIGASDLTAFADYQVPRVLRALGILQYSDQFAKNVDSLQIIAQGSPEEKAVRAATILACEEIAKVVGGTAADVDNLLWQSQDIAGDWAFHLTDTTWY